MREISTDELDRARVFGGLASGSVAWIVACCWPHAEGYSVLLPYAFVVLAVFFGGGCGMLGPECRGGA